MQTEEKDMEGFSLAVSKGLSPHELLVFGTGDWILFLIYRLIAK